VTATATYGATGDKYVDGVLSGVKWGVNTLTYSFPTSASFYGSSYGNGETGSNFAAVNDAQANAVRAVLKAYSSYANLTFNEVTESATTHGELRYARSDAPSTAWGYYPTTNAAGGDVWLNKSTGWYDAPGVGTYAYTTLLHETGHALGLKHPHEVSGAFGALPVDHDSVEYSVMSYRSYVGASTSTGYTNGYGSYPTTLMMYDIAAIQKLYGANYTTNAGDTVYSWNPNTGTMSINGVDQAAPVANKVFMTVWDGGGNDTYSFASYTTGVKVDLAPGNWSTTSSTQLAYLGNNHYAAGTIANALLYNGNVASLVENAIGGTGNDTMSGNQANNTFTGGKGNDVLDGLTGNDTAAYSSLSTNYSWVKNSDGSWTVTDKRGAGYDGVDTLKNIENLRFTDQTVQLGTSTPVTPTNVAPVGTADVYTTGKNAKLSVTSANGLLSNDTDANGDTLKAKLVSGPTKGTLSFNTDGSFSYTPVKNFQGTVTFKYAVTDGIATSAAVTVTIGVGPTAAAKLAKTAKANDHAHDNIADDQAPAEATSHHDFIKLWNDHDAFTNFHLPTLPTLASLADELTSDVNTVLSQLHVGDHEQWSPFGQGGLSDYLKAFEFHFV